jgi:putative nucleotidyltransferase with HDIG domain
LPNHPQRDDPDVAAAALLRARLDRLEHEAAERRRELGDYAAGLRAGFERERSRRTAQQRSYREMVLALANAVEARDSYTHRHAQRVAAYGLRIAESAGVAVPPGVELGFLLHDVGKIAMPDAVLFKPGPLDVRERAIIERHPEIGAEILGEVEVPAAARGIVRHHHERWDGAGYPDGLAGAQIPVHARIFAVADTLDALTTDRPYRAATSWASARAEIVACAGSQFDPSAVAAFESLPDAAFERIGDGLP